jgi:hypothetical protein
MRSWGPQEDEDSPLADALAAVQAAPSGSKAAALGAAARCASADSGLTGGGSTMTGAALGAGEEAEGCSKGQRAPPDRGSPALGGSKPAAAGGGAAASSRCVACGKGACLGVTGVARRRACHRRPPLR